METWKKVVLALGTAVLFAGCSRPVIKDSALPSKTKDQYLRIRRVAVFPFENYSDTKDADKTIDALLAPALRAEDVFDEVEDTRFTRDVMKKLKITATDILDKEILKKLGDEMNVQGIIYGKIVAYGKGKEKDASNLVTMDLALAEPSTGRVLYVGNVSVYGGLTVGKVFGVTEGRLDIDLARDAVRKLSSSLAYEIASARGRERKGIVEDVRKERTKEERELETLKAEKLKTRDEVEKARAEAKGIKETAGKEAETIKTELEMQKAALEAEKQKTTAAQQEIDQEKLKVELEKKKIAEDAKRIEEERKKLEETRKKAEEGIKEAPVKEAPPALPAPVPPAPAAPPPAAPLPSAPAPAPAPAPPPAPPVEAPAPAPPPAPAPAPPPAAPPVEALPPQTGTPVR
jgi:hypothetical protein